MKIQYPLSYNPIREYWHRIESGEEVVSLKVYKTYKHLNDKLEGRCETEFFYDPARGNHVLEFAENYCRHSKGKLGGTLVQLELWEKAHLATLFGFVDAEGNRQYQEALLIMGKKNGKSLLASIVGLYMLLADGENGPEVYAVATKRDQAKIIWDEAKRMVRKCKVFFTRLRCLVTGIFCDKNNGVFKPLSSDTGTLDGLNVSCALMDEIHQWTNGRALYDIIADGVSAREQPLIYITSTAGTVREDLYDEKYDEAERLINGWGDPDGYHNPRLIVWIYELDKRSEWTDERCWKKANPGLGTIKSLKKLREKVQKAIADPKQVKNLVCKEFNIRETSTQAWLTYDQADNRDTYRLDPVAKTFVWIHDGEERELPYPRYGIGGADLSTTTDLTAAKVLFMVPGCEKIFVLSMYWLAEELLEQHVKQDKIPYDVWRDRGLLRLTPGNNVHHKYVTEWFREVQEQLDIYIPWTGYDSWSARYWVEEMKGYFGENALEPVVQGMKTLSDPMKRLGNDLNSKRIVYNNNPIDKWCLCNTATKTDVNDNIQPHKTSNPAKRIDGTAALLDAYVELLLKEADYRNMI